MTERDVLLVNLRRTIDKLRMQMRDAGLNVV